MRVWAMGCKISLLNFVFGSLSQKPHSYIKWPDSELSGLFLHKSPNVGTNYTILPPKQIYAEV